MGKYIDADRLRAEIEQRLDKLNPKVGMLGDRPLRAVNPKTFPRESELEKVLGLINSLQQDRADADLENAAQHVYESWNGGTMDDVRRDMVELGKVLNARKP